MGFILRETVIFSFMTICIFISMRLSIDVANRKSDLAVEDGTSVYFYSNKLVKTLNKNKKNYNKKPKAGYNVLKSEINFNELDSHFRDLNQANKSIYLYHENINKKQNDHYRNKKSNKYEENKTGRFSKNISQNLDFERYKDTAILKTNSKFLSALAVDTVDREVPDFIDDLNSPCFYVDLKYAKAQPRSRNTRTHQNLLPRKTKPTTKPKTRKEFYAYEGGDQPRFLGKDKLASSKLRCLPGVYIAGFTKCGTTTFHAHVTQHQHIIGGVFKEPRFWDENRPPITHRRNITYFTENYETLSFVIENCYINYDKSKCHGRFDSRDWNMNIHLNLNSLGESMRLYQRAGRKCPLLGVDASSTYISNGHTWEEDVHNRHLNIPHMLPPQRLFHVQPHAKIIVLVRNPVERTFSDYIFFMHPRERSAVDFHNLVRNGIEWWNKCVQTLSETRCAFGENFKGTNMSDLPNGMFRWKDKTVSNGAGRLRTSLYVIYIEKWLKVFPRNSVLVIRLEDYKTNSIRTLDSEVYPFLGLEPLSQLSKDKITRLEGKGSLNAGKTKTEMSVESRKMLTEFYRPYNQRLMKLLGHRKYLWEKGK